MINFDSNLGKYFAIAALFFFMLATAFGPIHLLYASTHHDSSFRCPYMFGEKVLCGDDALAHLSSWKVFLGGFTAFFLYVFNILFVFFFSKKIFVLSDLFLCKIVSSIFNPFVMMFSSGLLNSKAP